MLPAIGGGRDQRAPVRRAMMNAWKYLLLAVLTAAPARADDELRILPTRDVSVEYRAVGISAEPETTVVARFASGSGRIRVDGPDGRFYGILDIDAERMIMVMPEFRLYMVQRAEPDLIAFFKESNAAFRRIGAERVAGMSCTAYAAAINDRTGQVCLTDDGVLLRAELADPEGRHEVEALRVTYSVQPEAYFDPPRGFRRVEGTWFGKNLTPGGGSRRGFPNGRLGP
jgi:hypothetical protein